MSDFHPLEVEIYSMKIHPKFIHHVFSHLYYIFPIFLLKQLKFICYQAHSVCVPLYHTKLGLDTGDFSLNFGFNINSSWGSVQPINRSIFPRGNNFGIFS